MGARWHELQQNSRQGLLWNGRQEVKKGVAQLGWGIVRCMLGSGLWGTAVRLAHFQPPTKTVGVVLALVSIAIILWGLRGFGNAIKFLGIKRLIILMMVIYLTLVAVNVLTLPDTRPVGMRILRQLGVPAQQVGNVIMNWAKSVIKAPDDFLFAYSGQRDLPSLPPGFPTLNPNATPVEARAIEGGELPVKIPTPLLNSFTASNTNPAPSVSSNSGSSALEIGGFARVVNTGGQSLRARLEPNTSSDVVAGFPQGSRLLIIDGPVVSNGFTWWKVRSENNAEGWCADQWLEQISGE